MLALERWLGWCPLTIDLQPRGRQKEDTLKISGKVCLMICSKLPFCFFQCPVFLRKIILLWFLVESQAALGELVSNAL
jgi:hypothetical protein